MEEALAQKYDRIQQFATRDWLGPSSVSLARLERVKANVHNITPTPSKHLRPSSASRTHKIYTELDTAPPLATKPLYATASAWGSNASIPELIKQQGERQTQQQVSTKGPRCPWGGRKVPASPSQLTQRRPSSETGAVEIENESQRRLNAFISVKGAKYDPKSRPPSGRGPRHTTGMALAELMVGLEELSKEEVDSTLEEFIRSQPSPGRHELARLSAAYGDHPSLIAPPPAPRGSPNPEEQTLLEEEGEMGRQEGGDHETETDGDSQDSPYKEIAVKQLLRRPTPEPVRLSMTIPSIGDDRSEPEEEVDYFNDSYRSDEASPDCKQPSDLELQSVSSEVFTQLEDFPTGPVTHPYRDQLTHLNADSQARIVSQNTPGTKNEMEKEPPEKMSASGVGLERELQAKSRSRHSVHIVEERNVTIDITPRDILKPFVPRPPVGRKRPQSAVTGGENQNSSAASANSSGSRDSNSSSVNRVPVRPKSARPRLAKVPTVGVNYGDNSEHSKKEDSPSHSESIAHSKTRTEVETMMSRIGLSDDETDDSVRPTSCTSSVVKQVPQSSLKKNYYELSRESSNPSQATLLTTKTIQLGDGGLMEQKSVSVIKQASEPFRSALLRQDKRKDATEGQRGRAGSASDEDASHRTHSAIRRPTKTANVVGTSAPPRPESRMGHRHGDADISTTPGERQEAEMSEANTDARPSLVSTRPFSALSKRRGVESASGRKSPGRIGRRPHSAKPPTNLQMGSDGSKLGSKSSTAIVTSPKKRGVDYKRNREAVKALREGTLNKDKKYTKQVVAVEEPRPVIWRPRKQASESSEEEEPQVVPWSAQEQEMQNMHQKLLESGVNVSAHTLARGLLPPTQRGYDDCMAELPEKSSLGLLNQPEIWLGKLFRKYKLAEKALVIANERMEIQAETEAKQAARGPAKKKRVGKRKAKRKRSSTVT